MSFLLGLLPALLDWLPEIFGAAGIGSGLLGLVRPLRPWLKWAPWVLLGLAVLSLLWFRGSAEACRAERAGAAAAAERAKNAVREEAEAESNRRIISLQDELLRQRDTGATVVERINHAAPSACPPSAAARAASRGLQQLVPATGGGAPATR